MTRNKDKDEKEKKKKMPQKPPLKDGQKQDEVEKKMQKNRVLADSAYGNVFPVATGGSSYNTATLINKKAGSIYTGALTPQIQKINRVIEPRGYKLFTQIGKGNYANVYSTVDKKNKMVALKVIHLDKASKNYRLKFLPRELKVMARVRHPNIVSIYEILQSSNTIYIFMEYASNGTISDFIKKNGPIKESECKPMFKLILKALHYMHSYGMSHRDIKVENILLNHKLVPKLTDFSYSKIEDIKDGQKRNLSRTFCGSLPYLSPEILQQQSYDPLISDIWSLGITLYVMLCDTVPFNFKNLPLMLNNQLSRNWKFHQRVVAKVTHEAKNIVSQMLEPDVNKRKTSTSLLLHQWIK